MVPVEFASVGIHLDEMAEPLGFGLSLHPLNPRRHVTVFRQRYWLQPVLSHIPAKMSAQCIVLDSLAHREEC